MKYFFVLIDLKSGKKGSNIDNIYKQRLATLSNEQKIKIKLLNNSASYSINEELIDLKTVKTMQYSPPGSSTVPIADIPVCNIIEDSIQDIPPVPLVDTPACDNNNSSIQDIPSPTFKYCKSTANPCYT